jgi:hypothetical protein
VTGFFRPFPLALAGGALLLTSVAQAASPKPSTGAGPAKASAAKTPPAKAGAKPASPALTPEQVVQTFLKAQQNDDDETAYALLSSDSKKKYTLDKWSDQGRQVRITFSAIKMLVGDTLLVGGAANAQNKVTGATIKGDKATVKIVQTVPVSNTLRLVKENGKWMIDIPNSLSTDEAVPATPATTTTPPKPVTPPVPITPAKPDYSQLCRSNLRQVGVAMRVYALDHDGKLPDASKWTDEITPYLDNVSLLRCPPDNNAVKSSYAMNAALSGAKLADIDHPEQRVLLYESTTTDSNVSGNGSTLPATSTMTGGYLVLMANGDAAFKTEKPQIR